MNIPAQKRRSYNDPGHAHELTFSCYKGYKFLSAERTCLWLADSLNSARVEHELALWAFVFMPEHVHMIVFPKKPAYDISLILKAIKEPVARRAASYLERHHPEWLERISQRRGHRVERHFWLPGGGYDRNITEPRTLQSMIEYIHLNPVRRGLVERAADWRWSSAAWFEGKPCDDLVPDRIPPEWAVT